MSIDAAVAKLLENFRAYKVDGDPVSGRHRPDSARMREFAALLQAWGQRVPVAPNDDTVTYFDSETGQLAELSGPGLQRAIEIADLEGQIDAEIETEVAARILELAITSLFDGRYQTDAALTADLSLEDGAYAIAMDTLTVYRKTGGPGAGGWSVFSLILSQFAGTASLSDVERALDTAQFALRAPPGEIPANVGGLLRWQLNQTFDGDPVLEQYLPADGQIAFLPGFLIRPDVGRVDFPASTLMTPFDGAFVPRDGLFWVVYSASDPDTRFGWTGADVSGHGALFTVYRDAGGALRAAGGGGDVAYVFQAGDAALFVGRKEVAAGIASLLPIFPHLAGLDSAGGGVLPTNLSWSGTYDAESIAPGASFATRQILWDGVVGPTGFVLNSGDPALVEMEVIEGAPFAAVTNSSGVWRLVCVSPPTGFDSFPAVYRVRVRARYDGSAWVVGEPLDITIDDDLSTPDVPFVGVIPDQSIEVGQMIADVVLIKTDQTAYGFDLPAGFTPDQLEFQFVRGGARLGFDNVGQVGELPTLIGLTAYANEQDIFVGIQARLPGGAWTPAGDGAQFEVVVSDAAPGPVLPAWVSDTLAPWIITFALPASLDLTDQLNGATSIAVTGLPAGLSVSGLQISGAVAEYGSHTVQVTPYNNDGAGPTRSFTITVLAIQTGPIFDGNISFL